MSETLTPKVEGTGLNRPKFTKKWLRPFVFLLGAMAVALPVAAIAVKPTYQIFTLKPGKSQDAEMTITNDTPIEVTYKPLVKEWFPLLKENKGIKTEDFISIPTKPFTLKPGESHLFRYTVNAPKKAKGELNGAVTFSSRRPGEAVETQMSLVQYIVVDGTEKVEAKIPGVAVKISSDTQVGVMIQNAGNVHLRPKGWIYVENDSGERIMNIEINNGQPVFAGAERVYSGTVKGFVLPAGTYKARVELEDMDRTYSFPTVTKKFRLTAEGKIENR